MKTHKELISDTEWENLIILDSFRFDYFRRLHQLYPNYDGKLRKIYTEASNSPQFCSNNFPDQYDISVYNYNTAVDVDTRDIDTSTDLGYQLRDHFNEVKSLWRHKPDSIEGRVEELMKTYSESKEKQIFWLMGTHTPRTDGELPLGGYHLVEAAEDTERIENLQTAVRENYEYTARSNLFHVSKLIDKLKGRTIITADHGELLSHDEVGHPEESKKRFLHHVPWLEIRSEDTVDVDMLSEEQFVITAYRNVLNRRPRKQHLDDYINHLEGDLTREQLFNRLIDSREFGRYADNWSDIHG